MNNKEWDTIIENKSALLNIDIKVRNSATVYHHHVYVCVWWHCRHFYRRNPTGSFLLGRFGLLELFPGLPQQMR